MSHVSWPLLGERPVIQIVLTLAQSDQKTARSLLADTGAGKRNAPFELLLDEHDCLLAGGKSTHAVVLGGSYRGSFPLYVIRVEIPQINFADDLYVVGVPNPPKHLEGIAGFRFLNRFTYGNFGMAGEFGLET